MRHLFLLLLAVLAVPTFAFANDTLLILSAGGLIPLKSTQIAVESEDLEISARIDGGELYNVPVHLPSKDPVNFLGFNVTVNGVPVRAEVESRALADGRDVTQRVKAVGLPASGVSVMATKALTRLTSTQRATLNPKS